MICLCKHKHLTLLAERRMSEKDLKGSLDSLTEGILYIVSTPIGNLEDITLRALRVLKEVDFVCAEDTRKTRILFNHYTIQTPLTSYFEHNEQLKTPGIIQALREGKKVAIVSEAGTPAISDPGYRLISQAIKESIPVIPIPGPSAAITALSISGLPVHRFAFEGFLPAKPGKRKNFIKKISSEDRTLIFYESPYRIIDTIRDLKEILGDRRAVLCREITKLYEEKLYGFLSTILDHIEKKKLKGEITIIVEGKRD